MRGISLPPAQGFRDTLTCDHGVLRELLVHFECPLILGQVPDLVTPRHQAPGLRPGPQGVRNDLEDDVAMTGPIAPARKGSQEPRSPSPPITQIRGCAITRVMNDYFR
jgi:hypothetical protein